MNRSIYPMLAVFALTLPVIAGAQDPRHSGQDTGVQPPALPLPMPGYPMPFPGPRPWLSGQGYGGAPFGPDRFMPPGQWPQDAPGNGDANQGGGMPPPWAQTSTSLRISREATPEAYQLRIAPGDGKTADIQVTPSGRGLTISRASDAQTTEERSFDDGRGYMKRFSFSSGAVSRRIPMPPDADIGAMSREESNGVVLIRIPRRTHDGGATARP